MSFKKSLCICASTLLMLSLGATSASASTVNSNRSHPNNKVTRMARHLDNVKRTNHVHARNVRKLNQIKRHLINHQKNLTKLARRINRAHRHRRDANLIKRLNNDKAQLIKAIENNERGMLKLAFQGSNEKHQINLAHHLQSQQLTTVNLPSVTSPSEYSTSKSVVSFINEVNGKLTKYGVKDANSWSNGRQSKSNEYSDVNGKYSASPDQISHDEMTQLNRQIQDEIQNSNNWFNESNNWVKEMNQEIDQDFDSAFNF